MSKYDDDYFSLVKEVLDAPVRDTRAGKTRAVFGRSFSVSMIVGFPLLTCRKMHYKGVFGELAAMLRGPKTVRDFTKYGCNYWNSWSGDKGQLNLDYGNKWLDFNGINQLEQVVEALKANPTDRRILISGWDPATAYTVDLPCCHFVYQWFVRDTAFLDMVMYMRSVDLGVGFPSDIAFAAAWNTVLANEVGLIPGKLTLMLGDTHVYENHVPQLKELLNARTYARPHYIVNPSTTTATFIPEDIKIINYRHSPSVKLKLNV